MKKKLPLTFAVVFLFSLVARADSVTMNFDIAYDGSIVASQGQLTLTLQGDGSILGQFTAPSITGYQFYNLDRDFAGPQSVANKFSVYFEDPSSSYNGCLAGNGFNCALQFSPGPVEDNFGTFSFQLDWYDGAPTLTSFDFLITQTGGFTSVSSFVALSGPGPCPNPPGYYAAVGCVDAQLFNEPYDFTGAIAQYSNTSPGPTPEPGSLPLLATGLLGMAPLLRRKI